MLMIMKITSWLLWWFGLCKLLLRLSATKNKLIIIIIIIIVVVISEFDNRPCRSVVVAITYADGGRAIQRCSSQVTVELLLSSGISQMSSAVANTWRHHSQSVEWSTVLLDNNTNKHIDYNKKCPGLLHCVLVMFFMVCIGLYVSKRAIRLYKVCVINE